MSDINLRKIQEQLNQRAQDKLKSRFFDSNHSNSDIIFLTSSNDEGVWRNGGRRGARFAPQAIINTFSSLNIDQKTREMSFSQKEVCQRETFSLDFSLAQSQSAQQIENTLSSEAYRLIIHLGGGHDHIYPLLKAFEKKGKPIGVINIDAHLDTRVDLESHSGTPFRQFAEETEVDFTLIQIGIHSFANAESNYEKFRNKKSKMLICSPQENDEELLHKEIEKSVRETQWIFSLDCDALESSSMQAVSAVNHRGLQLEKVQRLHKIYAELARKRGQITKILGIYEYNPIFDDLSQKGARNLCSFLYQSIAESLKEDSLK